MEGRSFSFDLHDMPSKTQDIRSRFRSPQRSISYH